MLAVPHVRPRETAMVHASIFSPARSRKMFRWAALLVVLGPFLCSCALLVNGTTQTIPVRSTPEGADVLIDGELRGVTPMDLVLRRGDTVVVTVRLGREQRDVVLTSRADGALIAVGAVPGVIVGAATISTCAQDDFLADLLCPIGFLSTLVALAPLAIDAGTGAWYTYDPDEIVVSFP
jgi:hypothetical protein